MRAFVSKKSSLLAGSEEGDDIDDPDNPYSSKGGMSGKNGFPRMSQASRFTGSKESFVGGKSGKSGPGGAMNFEDEGDLTPEELKQREQMRRRRIREDGSVELLDEYGDELDQNLEDGDYQGMGNLDGNYHGTSFGQLPNGEIDPNDPRFAKLTRKQ